MVPESGRSRPLEPFGDQNHPHFLHNNDVYVKSTLWFSQIRNYVEYAENFSAPRKNFSTYMEDLDDYNLRYQF